MPLWTVFDLDNTLILNAPAAATPSSPNEEADLILTPYAETERVLQFLASRGVIITMASFRTNAEQVLREHGLRDYFAAIEYTQDRNRDRRSKSEMINELAEQLNLSIYDAVFFDDLEENVEECNNDLIHTIRVDERKGVTMELLFDALLNALRPPFYVMSQRPLPREGLVNYLGEYRVTFLNCGVSAQQAFQITRVQPNATVMIVPAPNTIELFHGGNQVRVTYPDLYECLDAAVNELQGMEIDIPDTVGELVRR